QGKACAEKTVHTAGKPHHIQLSVDRANLSPDGKDLAYINVSVVDKDGNLCPDDQRLIRFSVSGAGKYRASANGDPTCLDLFHLPQMHLFNGQLTAIVQAGETEGTLFFEAKAEGLKAGKVEIKIH
ncbi:MAG: beta-galactosidase, partial [Dysgonamonadaceae bacterium]|nr:beta-galactosidase [Dysgonamonadaceae bacterium]